MGYKFEARWNESNSYKKVLTKSNEKSSAEINCGKRYEILYIKDSGHMQYEKY